MKDDLVILDGFHAVKHGLRFGAELVDVVELRGATWRELAAELAPDVARTLAERVRVVGAEEFARLSNPAHPTGLAAVARRPEYGVSPMARPGRILEGRPAPAVLLEQPRHLGNVGAVVRVAAGAGASGMLVTGSVDPWHPAVVRGAAGLQYALPVVGGVEASAVEGPLVAFDPAGEDIAGVAIPDDAVLVFGTERHGLSDELKARADMVVALPMRAGVSSLNLATSVAVGLYWWRLRH